MSRRTILNFGMGSRDPDFTSGEQEKTDKILSDDLLAEDLDDEVALDDLPV